MGKMGAGELNYSSDIDLICLFDETRYPGAEQEARASFIKVTRRMTAGVAGATPWFYIVWVGRVDASVSPRICSAWRQIASVRCCEAASGSWTLIRK